MGILKSSTVIAKYAEMSKKTLLKWIEHEEFPAKQMGCKCNSPYISHTDLVDDWFKKKIMKNIVNTKKQTILDKK